MRIKVRTLVAAAAVMIAGIAYLAHGNAGADDATRDEAYGTTTRTGLQELIASLPTPASIRARPFYIETGALRLEGQAIDGDEHPIAGATITLNGKRTTTSEGDGSFAFDGLAAADYRITAEKDTYYGEDTLSLEAASEPIELKLTSGPSIAVHVVAERGGIPVKDARLESSGRVAITDGNGDARLRGLDTNGATVEITAAGFASQRATLETGDDPKATLKHTVTMQPGAALEGIVVDDNGKAVAKAQVYVRASGSVWRSSIETDAAGAWHVDAYGPGVVTINATSDVHVATDDMLVEHDGVHTRTGIVVHVTRGATVSGLVVDGHGVPVAKAQVSVSGGWGKTDDHGHFDIVGLQGGSLDLSAQLESRGSVVQKIELAPGGHADVRITLVESSIAGVVVDKHGEPVENVQVYARSDEVSGGFARTDEHGHFDLGGMAPGVYELIATRNKDRQDLPNGPKVATGTRDVHIVLPDIAAVSGRVLLDGKPVAYFGVVVHADPTESLYAQPDVFRSPDGRFEQHDLRPGRWSIAIVGPDFARKDVANVDVREGVTTDLGDIVVTRGRIVRGRVTDSRGDAVANAFVAASVDSSSTTDEAGLRPLLDGSRTAHTDATGNYVIDGIADDAKEVSIQASDAHGYAAARKLAPGETVVDIVLARTGSIDGIVGHARDHIVRVMATSASGDDMFLTNVEAGGAFHIGRLPAGDYTVELRGRTAVTPLHVTVEAEVTSHVTFDLAPQPIELAIHDATCSDIIIRTKPDDKWLTFAQCQNGVATFDDITPGTYAACRNYDQCGDITVTAAPQRQELTLAVPAAASD